jgi:hypothetical protein
MWKKILNAAAAPATAGLAKITGKPAKIIDDGHPANMRKSRPRRLMKIIGTAGALTLLLAFPAQRIHSEIRTIKVPGPYPYEEPVRILAPPGSESAPSSSPAPVRDAKAAGPGRHSARTHRPLSAATVRKAAFKYNGVPNFLEFLAALPMDVGVIDAKLGRMRPLVKGGRVIRKNIAWLCSSRRGRRALAEAETESKKTNLRSRCKRPARETSGLWRPRAAQQRFHAFSDLNS